MDMLPPRFRVGDRVVYRGDQTLHGTVTVVDRSTHPRVPHGVTVRWDVPGESFATQLYENALYKERLP